MCIFSKNVVCNIAMTVIASLVDMMDQKIIGFSLDFEKISLKCPLI